MDQTFIAVVLLSTLAAGGIVYALFYPMLSGEARAEKRRKEFASPAARIVDRDAQLRAKRGQVAQSLKDIEKRESARTNVSLETRITQAGLTWSRRKYYVISVVTAVVTGMLLLMLTGNMLFLAGGLLIGGFGLPAWFLKRCRTRRLTKFGVEFPNAIDVIVRGIKAGLPLNDCMRVVAAEAQEPVRSEFRQIIEGQALGMSLTDSAGKLFERMPCAEANFFGIVLGIQQKTGGNLSETLGNLSRVLRERRKMRDKIQAISMEAKASAAIIGALPPIVMLLIYISSPKYVELLWTTQAGKVGLICGAFMMVMGMAVMRKMINFNI